MHAFTSTMRTLVAAVFGCAIGAACAGGSESRVETDAAGDARIRRTDAGADGPFNEANVPDLLSVTVSGWQSLTPATDPYNGFTVSGDAAHLVRIDVVVAGLVNPPGPLGVGAAFAPARFGPRALYGYIDFDIDRDRDTGGELGDAALHRFLANVGRFGELPEGSINGRAARSAEDYALPMGARPAFERSGAEWSLALCGCSDVTLVSQQGDGDQAFEPGETFIVRGRFFRRMAALQQFSPMFGGSNDGLYDPWVRLRFTHDVEADRTTVTLVYALTMLGAAQMSGQSQQSPDFDVGNHTSIEEGLLDLIETAEGLNGGLPGELQTLLNGWRQGGLADGRDPSDWRTSAIVGAAYTSATVGASFVWTDVGFSCLRGDFDGDGANTSGDVAAIGSFIAQRDGGPGDADGVSDGAVTVLDFGWNFSVYDLDGDGVVGPADTAAAAALAGSTADLNGDGFVNSADLALLLGAWGACAGCPADLTGDGLVNSADLAAMLGAWS